MEFFRRAANPWGQDVLLGIAWDLMWAAAIIGVVFTLGHAIYAWKFAPRDRGSGEDRSLTATPGIPERVTRHSLSARVFHWLMSATMIVLLVTAFVPVVGLQFPWVTIHWIAGVGLLATIVYHIVHATFWQDIMAMWIGKDDVQAGRAHVKGFFGKKGESTPKPGKYPVDHKLYHNTVSVVTVAAIVTGLLMMVRVDTPFWTRNPYILGDTTWGFVYVVHGISGVALITLVMAHIYFAVRPDKWWITRSMIAGWIRRDEYLAHHDPNKWVVAERDSSPSLSGVGGKGAVTEGIHRDRVSDG